MARKCLPVRYDPVAERWERRRWRASASAWRHGSHTTSPARRCLRAPASDPHAACSGRRRSTPARRRRCASRSCSRRASDVTGPTPPGSPLRRWTSTSRRHARVRERASGRPSRSAADNTRRRCLGRHGGCPRRAPLGVLVAVRFCMWSDQMTSQPSATHRSTRSPSGCFSSRRVPPQTSWPSDCSRSFSSGPTTASKSNCPSCSTRIIRRRR